MVSKMVKKDTHKNRIARVFFVTHCSILLFFAVSTCVAENTAQQLQTAVSENSDRVFLTTEQLRWIRDHKPIRFTGDPNWLPFEAFTEKGEYIGIVSEILKEVERRAGLEFDRIPSSTWLNALKLVKNFEADVISGDLADEEIRRTHTFTKPYLKRPLAIVMRNEQQDIVPDLYNIADKRIAMIEGYGYTWELIDRYPQIQFIEVSNIQDALTGLSNGRFDAFVSTFTAASYHINQLGVSDVRIVGRLPIVMKVGLAVRNDWPELLSILNKTIATITPAEKQHIVDQWMQDKYIKHTDTRIIWQIVSAAATLLLLMLIWNYAMGRQRKKLRLSEERFQSAMAAVTEAIWEWDLQSNARHFSKGFFHRLGYSDNEIPRNHQKWLTFIHPDDQRQYQTILDQQATINAADNSPLIVNYRIKDKAGNYIYVESRGRVIKWDENGNAVLRRGTLRDVSQQQIALQALKEREKQLQNLNKRFSLAVKAISLGVWQRIMDGSSVIQFDNRMYEIYGLKNEGPLQLKTWFDMIHVDDKAIIHNCFNRLIAFGGEDQIEFRIHRHDGNLRYIYAGVTCVKGEDGEPDLLIGVNWDITDRKAAEDEVKIFRRFAEMSKAGFGMANKDASIIYMNQALSDILGETDTTSSYGASFAKYYSEADQQRLTDEILPIVLDKGQWSGELQQIRRDGSLVPTYESFFLINDDFGNPQYYGDVVTDITKQKNTEKALADAKNKAEEASRFKSEFLANMSHEIRTPLNAILGMTHLAQQTKLTARQRDYLNKILSSSHTLLGVINDILDFSKIEAGRLSIEKTKFQLESVFENLSNLESAQAAEKGVEVIFSIGKDVPQSLIGDPLRLGQILINLTNNAVKFTEQGQIVVAVILRKTVADKIILQFSVQDSGIGIEPDQIKRLFQPFTQADGSTTRRYGGTGLGLAISKQLVTMMNGEIAVDSIPGAGSTFYFTAEFERSKESIQKPYNTPPDLRNLRILIVDDNAIARQTLTQTLESFSFKVTAVASGSAALTELEKASQSTEQKLYDLVLMDWKMPDMDGIETSRLINQSDWLPHIPTIIMVTAYGREEVMQAATEVGIDSFLAKPVNPSILFDTIVNTLVPRLDHESSRIAKTLETPDFSGSKVLVVEDNHINQQVASELLENAGIEVQVVDNGGQAVQAVRSQHFDLVLMDLQMPDMDGFQSTRIIRKEPRFATLPIIAMTAHAMTGDKEKCLAAGMNDHLPKPVDPNQLYAILKQWLGQNSQSRAVKTSSKQLVQSLEPLPEKLAGIDINLGLARICNNRKLYRTLLTEFIEDHRSDDELLANELRQGNLSQARHLAHTLRSVAGSIGAEELEEKAGALEEALKNNQSYVEPLVPFVGEFSMVMKSLVNNMDTLAVNDSVETNFDEDKTQPWLLTQKLENLLQERNARAKECLAQCKAYLQENASANKVALLEEQIAGFDFDEANVTLQEILSEVLHPA